MADLQALNDWASENDLEIVDGLIQNDEPITRSDASARSTRWLLRWRNRVCEDTGKTFDITECGYLYRSGVGE